MFVALEVLPAKQSRIFSRRLNILTKPKIWLEHRELCGAHYAVVYAETIDGGPPDWSRLAEVVGSWSQWILLPPDLMSHFPQGSELRPFCAQAFAHTMLLRTACQLVEQGRIPMFRRSIGLLDTQGEHAGMLDELLKYYTSAVIVTEQAEQYQLAIARVFSALGAPVYLRENPYDLQDCILALSPAPFFPREDEALPCPIMTLNPIWPNEIHSPAVLSGLEPGLPMGASPPGNISRTAFAAALSTLCGLEDIVPMAHTLQVEGKTVPFEQAVHWLRQYTAPFL